MEDAIKSIADAGTKVIVAGGTVRVRLDCTLVRLMVAVVVFTRSARARAGGAGGAGGAGAAAVVVDGS